MSTQRFIFDVDGTLLVPDYSYEKEYFMSILSEEEASRFLPMIEKLIDGYERKYIRYNISLLSEYLTCESGILISPKMIIGWQQALSETTPKIIDGVVETLEELKHYNKSLAIFTNWFSTPQIIRLEKAGLKEYFDDFYGGELFIKPNRQGFINACGNYPIADSIMIGDSLEDDIYGAMEIGLDAIYYQSEKKDDFDKSKVKSIRNMREIRSVYENE